ncbi:hypothetical protein R3P38DRAFT_892389 [Favolaschia claudopus]|uniref:DUF6534 domain-containing protein n=1 Tax=Favolaschia claudopus TaxID=2862362 RepID=A0AAW0BTU4_9AGAR
MTSSGPPPELLKSITRFILGAYDLGICGDLLLQGALFAQFAHFASLYHRDIVSIRAFVWGLMVLTTFKTVQCLVLMWNQNVKHFADVMTAGNMFKTDWYLEFNIGFSGLLSIYVQAFFVQRLWVLSKNLYLIGGILTVFVLALIAALIAAGFTLQLNDNKRSEWTSAHLGITVAGDLLLTGSTVFYLLRHSKEVLPETAGMLKAILRLTLQSAAPAAICALINLIVNQILGASGDGLNGMTSVAIICSVILPKLYAVSAMWTLNSRKAIRLARSNGHTTSSNEARTAIGFSGGRRGTHNVELGNMNVNVNMSGTRTVPIQVRTQVQTVQHSDVESDVYTPKAGADDFSEHAVGRGKDID